MAGVLEFPCDGLDGHFVGGLVEQDQAALSLTIRAAVQAREHLIEAGGQLLEGFVDWFAAGGQTVAPDDCTEQAHAVLLTFRYPAAKGIPDGLLAILAWYLAPAFVACVHRRAVQLHVIDSIGTESAGDLVQILLDPVGLPFRDAETRQHEPRQARIVAGFIEVEQVHGAAWGRERKRPPVVRWPWRRRGGRVRNLNAPTRRLTLSTHGAILASVLNGMACARQRSGQRPCRP